jgi:hypothetical protein
LRERQVQELAIRWGLDGLARVTDGDISIARRFGVSSDHGPNQIGNIGTPHARLDFLAVKSGHTKQPVSQIV